MFFKDDIITEMINKYENFEKMLNLFIDIYRHEGNEHVKELVIRNLCQNTINDIKEYKEK